MRVVATAGHVDHGKSALVKALSGIDPDRLIEEQVRQMTIDLGFAWSTLPDGEPLGIIDVPGHEDFVENMLAGVGGIDAFVLVVAADEGPKPQTIEHAEILGLLRMGCGVVALTRSDLVREAEWLPLVRAEVDGLLRRAELPPLAQVPVSSVTGEGLGALRAALGEALATAPVRIDRGRPRLSVDRVFSMEGFGTVATGTLTDGSLRTGQDVEIAPAGRPARIRGLQTHGEQLTLAEPGRRLAVNLSGVAASEIRRGDVLIESSSYIPSSRIDVRLHVLPSAGAGLRHGESVKAFHGTARRMARVRLLEADQLVAGEDGWAQLELDLPLVASPRDRLILRRPSPARTIAGGQIADIRPARRHRRHDETTLKALERALSNATADRLAAAAEKLGPATAEQVVAAAGLPVGASGDELAALIDRGVLVTLGGEAPTTSTLISATTLAGAWRALEGSLEEYHRRFPLRLGMPKEELKSRSGLEAKQFAAGLEWAERHGRVERLGTRVRLAGAGPELSEQDRRRLDQFHSDLRAAPYSPMSTREARALLGDELLLYEFECGALVQVSSEVFFEARTYQEMVDRVRQAAAGTTGISVAEVRDLFRTSRKYALALMEHLDEIGLTSRQGDLRSFLGPPPASGD